MSKAELYRVYAGKSPTEMFVEFMLQPELKAHCALITRIAEPLERSYSSDLQTQDKGIEEMLAWSAARARGEGWFHTTKEILQVAFSLDLALELDLTLPMRPPLQLDLAQAWMLAPWR